MSMYPVRMHRPSGSRYVNKESTWVNRGSSCLVTPLRADKAAVGWGDPGIRETQNNDVCDDGDDDDGMMMFRASSVEAQCCSERQSSDELLCTPSAIFNSITYSKPEDLQPGKCAPSPTKTH